MTLDRLPLRDFSKDGRREHRKQDVFPDSKFWGRTPKTLPGKSFLVPKLLPLRTEKCVQKAFPLHRNLIMAWLHLLGFIHFYCSFHYPPPLPPTSLRNRRVIRVGTGSWVSGIYGWGLQSGEGSEVRTRRKEGHEGPGEAQGEVGWRGLKGAETGSSLHCFARSSCRRPSKTPKSRRKPGDSTGGVPRL